MATSHHSEEDEDALIASEAQARRVWKRGLNLPLTNQDGEGLSSSNDPGMIQGIEKPEKP